MKKKILLIIAVIMAVAVIAGIAIAIFANRYGSQDFADKLSADERYEYNYILTVFGRNANLTGDNEVLIVDTVNKSLGGDTEAIFYIYRYEKESDLAAALNMTAEQIAENSNYEYMGFGNVTLVDDSFAGMCNMNTVYVK